MKNLMIGTALALLGSLPAVAQDVFRPSSDANALYASDFIGMRIYAAETAADAETYAGVQEGWNDIGEINDIVLGRDGSVEAVLVDIGGFLGMGERQVAVDMKSIRFAADSSTADSASDFFLVLNADRALLEGAPVYERGSMSGTGTNTGMTDTTAATATTDQTATTDTAATPSASGATMLDGYTKADMTTMTTEELTGVDVYGANDESLGEISDFVLAGDKMISHVVVDVGGFLGIATRPVAIDAKDLQLMRADGNGEIRAYVAMTKGQIESLPEAKM